MTIRDKILKLLQNNSEISVNEIVNELGVSKQAIHLALNKLVEELKVEKLGRVPKTFYRLAKYKDVKASELDNIDFEEKQTLDRNFILITEIGQLLSGSEAFEQWCRQRKLSIKKTLSEYISTFKKHESYISANGLIDGINKLQNTKEFNNIHLDKVYYLDFYAIERFGKTKLGNLLHYAKQGQNKYLMKLLVDECKEKIHRLIAEEKYNAVAFVPPTIRREVQLMKFIRTHLKINLPEINIQKNSGLIPVPQKSLHKMEERIRNADSTFVILEKVKYDKILLIDDAIGSGATLNQIAAKIKSKSIAQSVTGLAIVGSFKGFDVITDV